MERIAKVSVIMAFIISACIIYLFVDLAGQLVELRNERDKLAYDLDLSGRRSQELNLSLVGCNALLDTLRNESEDYYNKWQAEMRIAYALWQIFDAAMNITWQGQDYTQVCILVPRWQFEYLRNLSEHYGLHYVQG